MPSCVTPFKCKINVHILNVFYGCIFIALAFFGESIKTATPSAYLVTLLFHYVYKIYIFPVLWYYVLRITISFRIHQKYNEKNPCMMLLFNRMTAVSG